VSKIKSFLAGAGVITGGLLYIVMGILGLLIHLYTILMALGEKGIVAALITLAVPVFSEIYWGIYSWNMTGTFFNTYSVALGAYILLFIISMGIMAFSTSKMEG
jgi:hypothetical protein